MLCKKGDLVEVRHVLGAPAGKRGVVIHTTPAISDDDPKGVLVMINSGREISEWYAWQLEVISEK